MGGAVEPKFDLWLG